MKRLKKRVLKFLKTNKLLSRTPLYGIAERYLSSSVWKAHYSIYQGLAVNFFYAVLKAAEGIFCGSVWMISMAVYYLLLGTVRLYLAHYRRISALLDGDDALRFQYKCYGRTGLFLLVVNIPMTGATKMMIDADPGIDYPGSLIYASALLTFYMMTTAIINMVKFKRIGDPILSASKTLNFVAAMVSMLGLQAALISRFSENSEDFRKLMSIITGTVIFGAVIIIAVFMALKSRRKLKELSCESTKEVIL